MDSMSPADMRAVLDGHDNYGCGDGYGFGGSWFAWILLFALMGGNGFGWGNRGGNPVTESDLCNANSFNDLKSSVRNVSDQVSGMNIGLTKGLCDFGYTTLEQFNNVEQQIAACCCETQTAIGQVRYDMAVQNGDLKALIHSEGEATRNLIQQNKIETLQQQVSQLQLAQALCGIPRTNPYGYGIYAYPACAGLNCCGCTTNI